RCPAIGDVQKGFILVAEVTNIQRAVCQIVLPEMLFEWSVQNLSGIQREIALMDNQGEHSGCESKLLVGISMRVLKHVAQFNELACRQIITAQRHRAVLPLHHLEKEVA